LGNKFTIKHESGDKGQSKIDKEVEFKAYSTFGDFKGLITGTLDKKFAVLANHKVSDVDTVGFQLKAEFPEKKEGDKTDPEKKVCIDLAVQHKACSSAHVQGKLSFTPAFSESGKTGIKFGLGSTYAIPKTGAVATIGADINLMNIGNLQAHSVGFELKLK